MAAQRLESLALRFCLLHTSNLLGEHSQQPASVGAEAINSAVMEKPSQPSLSAEDKQLILNQVPCKVVPGISWLIIPMNY